MYNRYIPGQNGVYQRQIVPESKPEPKLEPVQSSAPISEFRQTKSSGRTSHPFSFSRLLPQTLETGDLLVLLILLLILVDGETEDPLPILLMIAAFMFL